MNRSRALLITTWVIVFGTTLYAQPTSAAHRRSVEHFESKVRPLLVTHCYACHSTEFGKARGGLRVDTRTALLTGGDSGPAVVPGDPDASLLIQAIRYQHPKLKMPPKDPLPEATVRILAEWIKSGAAAPDHADRELKVRREIDLEKGRAFWAYRKPVAPELPTPDESDWGFNDLDRFVRKRQETRGVQPAPLAAPESLVRRAWFLLTGLPPSPDDAATWARRLKGEGAARQIAFAALVDELLASPAFGERWGRHWMDVARFAESTGGDSNNIHPHAWRYRDYVIDAFNADRPFDRFILEQLAGDLLPAADDREWARNLVATGFLAVGQKLVGEVDERKFFAELVDEQIDATSRAFLATTVACARCHDHKFDPIRQRDYYALAAIFRSTETHFGGLANAQARQSATLLDVSGLGLPAARKPLTQREYRDLVHERDRAHATMDDILSRIRSGEQVRRNVLLRSRTQRDRADMELAKYDANGAPRQFVMGVQDREFPMPTRLLVRGEVDREADKVAPGLPGVLARPDAASFRSETTSGRLELARWIASPDHPLTARVIVNRVWHWMFGQGLVRTVDDFGRTGELPSHPELLDHLARRFVTDGWSIKRLVRHLALSKTWQLSAQYDRKSFAIDPENRLLWRTQPRRLEAEAIRDAMLTASGALKRDRPVGTLLDSVGEGQVGRAVFEPEIRTLTSSHRSVYLPRVRNVLPEMLELFDAPNASLVTGAREVTSSPLQALYLMNSPFVLRQADGFATRVAAQPERKQIEYAYLVAYGRKPTSSEKTRARRFLSTFKRAKPMSRDGVDPALAALCHALMCATEFWRTS